MESLQLYKLKNPEERILGFKDTFAVTYHDPNVIL